jgi:hypothetical protein
VLAVTLEQSASCGYTATDTTAQGANWHIALFFLGSHPVFDNSISKHASENLSAGTAASCRSKMNEYDPQAHQCEHSFRTIRKLLARAQDSLTEAEQIKKLGTWATTDGQVNQFKPAGA